MSQILVPLPFDALRLHAAPSNSAGYVCSCASVPCLSFLDACQLVLQPRVAEVSTVFFKENLPPSVHCPVVRKSGWRVWIFYQPLKRVGISLRASLRGVAANWIQGEFWKNRSRYVVGWSALHLPLPPAESHDVATLLNAVRLQPLLPWVMQRPSNCVVCSYVRMPTRICFACRHITRARAFAMAFL
ncbi:hypothetical protein TRVL_06544 [Trypanosoma vivax]|nr:hypothetical protein TRVL_06544 [Trypanosoma vivax]